MIIKGLKEVYIDYMVMILLKKDDDFDKLQYSYLFEYFKLNYVEHLRKRNREDSIQEEEEEKEEGD